MLDAAQWQDLPSTAWTWRNFTPQEMACHGDGSLKIDERFMDRLEQLRARLGAPLVISSGYRSPAYNATVSDTGADGPHTTGHAADITVSGAEAFRLIKVALELGFTGLGVSQRGDHAKRFIHIDDLAFDGLIARPTVWSY